MAYDSCKESDWQVFRELRPIALERLCERILQQLGNISADDSQSKHQRYLKIYHYIQEQDKEIALGFDHNSRNRAFEQILFFQSRNLLVDEEFSRFSKELCTRVTNITAIVTED